MTTIKLTGDRQRDYAIECIRSAPDGYVVKLGEDTRSERQNRWLHAILADIAKADTPISHHPIESMKLIFMHELRADAKVLPTLDGKGIFPIGQRTSTLSKTQFAGLQEIINHYCAVHGVVSSERNPYEDAT